MKFKPSKFFLFCQYAADDNSGGLVIKNTPVPEKEEKPKAGTGVFEERAFWAVESVTAAKVYK